MFQCSSASRKFLNSWSSDLCSGVPGVSVLFSEPKIPQSSVWWTDIRTSWWSFSALQRAENSSIEGDAVGEGDGVGFSALQRAENSSIRRMYQTAAPTAHRFQCSSASRKFLNAGESSTSQHAARVSVLFSEPKIPQFSDERREHRLVPRRFSALQRAENSSISGCRCGWSPCLRFQCSSASRKFLNAKRQPDRDDRQLFQCSSASRKFLNRIDPLDNAIVDAFQCSSASRKFLNCSNRERSASVGRCFSALQRAENSSIRVRRFTLARQLHVSVLFSEPKIPQSNPSTALEFLASVSVLFSEPKIPQLKC